MTASHLWLTPTDSHAYNAYQHNKATLAAETLAWLGHNRTSGQSVSWAPCTRLYLSVIVKMSLTSTSSTAHYSAIGVKLESNRDVLNI